MVGSVDRVVDVWIGGRECCCVSIPTVGVGGGGIGDVWVGGY